MQENYVYIWNAVVQMRFSKTDYIKLVYNIRNILNFIPQASNIMMKNTNIDLLKASPWVGPGFISTSLD